MTDLSGRVALVTGSSRGIGRAVAIGLANAGADVAVNYIENENAARKTREDVTAAGRRAIVVQADVSRDDDVSRMVEKIEAALGPVDILVNNAGVALQQSMDEITEADWDQVLNTNLKAVFLVTRRVLPGMRQRRWGRIVNGAVRPGWAAA